MLFHQFSLILFKLFVAGRLFIIFLLILFKLFVAPRWAPFCYDFPLLVNKENKMTPK